MFSETINYILTLSIITNSTENIKSPVKTVIIDTSYFIKLKPLDASGAYKYYTTEFIVKEIRDENSRNFYKLNKDFITVRNPSKENMLFSKYRQC